MVKQAARPVLLLCFLMIAAILDGIAHDAWATNPYATPANPGVGSNAYNTAKAACLATKDLDETCDCDIFALEMTAKQARLDMVQQAASDNKGDRKAFDNAVELNIGLGNYGRCQIKIDAMKTYREGMAMFGAGMASVDLAIKKSVLQAAVDTAVGAACNAVISGVQGLLAQVCLPTVSLTLPAPQYPFPIYPGACGGPPLLNVTGGLQIYSPPAGYGPALPEHIDDSKTPITE